MKDLKCIDSPLANTETPDSDAEANALEVEERPQSGISTTETVAYPK